MHKCDTSVKTQVKGEKQPSAWSVLTGKLRCLDCVLWSVEEAGIFWAGESPSGIYAVSGNFLKYLASCAGHGVCAFPPSPLRPLEGGMPASSRPLLQCLAEWLAPSWWLIRGDHCGVGGITITSGKPVGRLVVKADLLSIDTEPAACSHETEPREAAVRTAKFLASLPLVPHSLQPPASSLHPKPFAHQSHLMWGESEEL